jgi:chromosomal replication initiation ATPase DnaA
MYLSRQLCNRSLKEIAEVFSPGSYGSIGEACSVIEGRLKLLKSFRKEIGLEQSTTTYWYNFFI